MGTSHKGAAGTATRRIPRLREGAYFPNDVVLRWSLTDTALTMTELLFRLVKEAFDRTRRAT